jgi:hypothetical protein
MGLYEVTVQIVPVLMIALFVDSRTSKVNPSRSARIQNRVYIVLSVVAFVVALLTVAQILAPSRPTEAIVLSALIGCIVLMGAQAWSRFSRSSTPRPSSN